MRWEVRGLVVVVEVVVAGSQYCCPSFSRGGGGGMWPGLIKSGPLCLDSGGGYLGWENLAGLLPRPP